MTGEEYLRQAAEQQRAAAIAALQQQYNTSVGALDTEKATIDPEYLKAATAADVTTQQNARRLREIMANRGYATGQQWSNSAALLAAGQQGQSDLGLQRTQKYGDIASRRSLLDTNYASQQTQTNADIDAQLNANLYADRQATIDLATRLFTAGLMSAADYAQYTSLPITKPKSGTSRPTVVNDTDYEEFYSPNPYGYGDNSGAVTVTGRGKTTQPTTTIKPYLWSQ